MVVAERASRRDGAAVEELGSYSPRESVAVRYLKLKLDRIEHWLKVGALPSDTARTLIARAKKMAAAAPVAPAAPKA